MTLTYCPRIIVNVTVRVVGFYRLNGAALMNVKLKCVCIFLTTILAASTIFAGERFEQVLSTFDSAEPISESHLTSEIAFAGYCVSHVDDVSDALFSYRKSYDPIFGQSLKSLEIETPGSSGHYVRISADAVRDEISKMDSSFWNEAKVISGELVLRSHWRFHTTIRQAIDPQNSKLFLVSLRQCKSSNGRDCNGHGSDPFIMYEACYYYAQKF